MRAVLEAYIGIWSILVLLLLCLSFTSINMNVKQANKMYDSLKAQVQASNGSFISDSTNEVQYNSSTDTNGNKISTDGFQYSYTIKRESVADSDISDDSETFIYNDIYSITFVYKYAVPLFGTQTYPISGYSN